MSNDEWDYPVRCLQCGRLVGYSRQDDVSVVCTDCVDRRCIVDPPPAFQ